VPTYDYQCRSCGTTTEVIHSMLEEGPTSCARCGGQLRRVLFPAGIIFKGSGFYKTDSRSSGSDGNAAGGTAPAAAKPKAGDAASSSEGSSTASSSTGSSPESKATSAAEAPKKD
jgi:putative FmdB family regulatory protein